MLHRLHALSLALMLALAPVASFASQNSLSSPTGGTVSGLQLTNNYNNAIDSVNTCNSGGSAPSNQLSASPSLGNCWWNTSTNAFGYFDGTSWVPLGWFDTANHYWQGIIGGGAINSIASATTTDLCSQKPATVLITGTTTITSFGSNCQVGQIKKLVFSGASLTLTQSGNVLLPNGGSNITTASGDAAEAVYAGSGVWRVTAYTLANGQPLNTSAVAVGTSAFLSSAVGMNSPLNLQLNATVASNNLTIAVKGVNGSDPSPTNPVLVAFRDTTAANGTTIFGSIQAALSMTVNAGNSLGSASGVPARVWVELICQTQSGTTCTSILLGVSVQSTASSCLPLPEGNTGNTGSGTAGGSNAGTIYTSVASLSGKGFRIAGYVEITEATAGTWATGATLVHVFGLGDKKPCDTVQTAYIGGAALSNTSTTNTDFASNVSVSIAPTSSANLVRIDTSVVATDNNSTAFVTMKLKRGGVSGTALTSNHQVSLSQGAVTYFLGSGFNVLDAPSTTSSTNYVVTYQVNGGAGGIATGEMILQEIMGALEPANDDQPMSVVG